MDQNNLNVITSKFMISASNYYNVCKLQNIKLLILNKKFFSYNIAYYMYDKNSFLVSQSLFLLPSRIAIKKANNLLGIESIDD